MANSNMVERDSSVKVTWQAVSIMANGLVKGWKIVGSDGSELHGFTTRAEAQRLLDFFNR